MTGEVKHYIATCQMFEMLHAMFVLFLQTCEIAVLSTKLASFKSVFFKTVLLLKC